MDPGFQTVHPMERRRPRNIPSRPLVLVAADHRDTRDMYVASLTFFGFEALPVDDYGETFRKGWECHPEAVVVDLPLLSAEGWQLVRDFRHDARTRDIAIVLLSGYAAPSVRERAVREGCAAYLVKPCLPEQLALTLRRVLDTSIVLQPCRHRADAVAVPQKPTRDFAVIDR